MTKHRQSTFLPITVINKGWLVASKERVTFPLVAALVPSMERFCGQKSLMTQTASLLSVSQKDSFVEEKKFGLNSQVVCDGLRRFIDVSISHPASASDCLSFATSPLHHKLEQQGFFAPDVCMFGDDACGDTSHMATPFKSVKSRSNDAHDFCQSRVRINIEWAFAMLVNKWGVLQKALPVSMGLKKTTATTICPCRLRNFCIDRRTQRNGEEEGLEDEEPLLSLAQDHFETEMR